MQLISFLLGIGLSILGFYFAIIGLGYLIIIAWQHWYISMPLVMLLIILGFFSFKPPK